MASEDERLVVALEARIRDFEKNFEKAQRTANSRFTAIEARAARARQNLEQAFSATGAKLAAGLGAYLGTRQLIDYADTWTRATNALKVAGLSGADLTTTMNELYAAAQRQGVPIEALTTLFGRASQAAKELGATRSDLVQFSEDVATALRVAGTTPEAASGALLQLSQLLGSSRVQAEEFNSVNEAARPILQAVANGIEEAGGSVSKLKALVTDGEISNVAFFKGFQVGVQTIRDQAASAEPTIGQAFTRVTNAITKMVGEVDRSAGFTRELVGELTSMAEGFDKATGPIKEVVALLQKLADLYAYLSQNGLNLGKKLNQAVFGTDTVEQYLFPPAPAPSTKSGTGGIGSDPDRNLRPPVPSKPIKAADYPVVGSSDGKDRIDQYEREVAAINKSTEALKLETATLGQSAYAIDYAKTKQELLNAAKEAGKEITPQLTAEIEKEAAAHAQATAALESARKKQEQLNELKSEFGGLAMSSIQGLIDGTKSWNDVLKDSIDLIIELMLKAALLGQGPFGDGGGGLVGALFKAVGFADGGYVKAATGGYMSGPGTSTSDSIRARLSNGEFVVNAAATKQHRSLLEGINAGRLPNLASGAAGVGAALAAPVSMAFSPTFNVDASGSSMTPESMSATILPLLQEMRRQILKEVPVVVEGARARMLRSHRT